MKVMRLIIPLLFWFLPFVLSAQEFLEIDLSHHCNFGGAQMDEELYSFTSGSSVMENLVAEVLELGGNLEQNFTLIQTNVESVSAVVAGDKRYLLWSQDFLERATKLQAFASVAHMIGHHVNGHTLDNDRQYIEEEEANIFMGFILGRERYSEEHQTSKFLADNLEKLFNEKNGHQFTNDWDGKWLSAAQTGVKKAENALKIGLGAANDPSLERFELAAFPFPPPPCYQQLELAPRNFNGCATLGQVAKKITSGLKAKKYPHRYLSVPQGYAIVTQIEQYNSSGTPLPGADRWKELPVQENFSLTFSYLKSLVFPRKANLRLFVFLVTTQNFNATGNRVSREAAKGWFNEAVNRLPKVIADTPYTAEHTVEMLVYEFEVPESNQRPKQNCPCHLTAEEHLGKSGLGNWLKQ